jgi:hypothetical protein
MSVHCIELLHRGARATGVCTGICTWAVQHLGIGKGVLTWAFYRAASKSALFLDLFVKAGFPVFK